MKKKILILGGFGFIGTNLTEELLKRGDFDIVIFESKDVTIQNPDLLKYITVYYGDFNNEKDYEIIFQENQITYVIHLIGMNIPSLSNENIMYDINFNLINTIKLLNIIRQYKVKRVVFLSSGGTVYGILKDEHKESHPTNPISSYGILKLTIEKYFYLYNYLYGINYLILRPSNPYGKYHKNPQHGLINVILKNILNGETVKIWGDGLIIRDFIYINDLVRIIVDLIEKNIQNEIINIGSNKGYSINNVLNIIKKEIGDFPLKYLESRKVDVPCLILNINKLEKIINLNLTSIEEGIKSTYKWLKAL